MKPAVLLTALLAGSTFAQAQLQVGRTFQVDYFGSETRGTDTLYTFGVEQAVQQSQIAGYITPGGGNLFGNSEYPTNQFAQEFELIDGPANVDGIVYLWADRVYASNNPSSHVKARLYRMDGTGGQTSAGPAARPNTVVREVEFPLANMADGEIRGVSFAPVWFSGKFAAGFSLTGLAAGDSVNLAATSNGFVEQTDRSWLTFSGQWATVRLLTTDPNTPGSGQDIDFFVGAVLTPSAVSVGESAWLNGMQLDILGGNPARDSFTLRYAVRDAANMRLFIIDAMGRTVVDQELGRQTGEHQREVNIQGWASGTYFVNMIANGRPITKRVVVE